MTIIVISLISNACKKQNTEDTEEINTQITVINKETIINHSPIIPKDPEQPFYNFNIDYDFKNQDMINTIPTEEYLTRRDKFLENETEEEKLEREINSAPERIRYSRLK